ncbi:Cof-type HAD-IIB family hydrolase [Neisseria leonii]|uniref:Cof-type HAD-IIB family hydrolase n=1 Tax=Neisseria leonii TaxID=2995413 RepID=A0A9X4E0Y1_9NEIS|nr:MULTISPECIES: Cof-type HAD-IIB family hydrolase [unclassified Neisseria]MDD9324979.1 Cof-type HAD-IIB family hydrolase [Neisseria sp. 3986]MDD9327470.1 Cof-type HAD-IIB family hydrolase [Neisseria sp. 51.81]
MNRNQPKIVFFDIDDTLYIKGERRVPDSARQALAALRRRGTVTAIATGRTPAVLPEAVKSLIGEGIDILVCINGQYVARGGEVLAHFPMDAAAVSELTEKLTACGIAVGHVSHRGITVSHESGGLLRATRDLGIAYADMPSVAAGQPVYQMLAFYPPQREAEVAALLPEGIKTVRWHAEAVDLLDADGSKARGIAAVLAHLGWQAADAAAFGDGLNDLEMMAAVGFGVAVGNAVPELKAVADYIAPPVDSDGLARALRDLGWID